MDVLLVVPSSTQWDGEVSHGPERSYLDAMLRGHGGINAIPFFPIEHIGLGFIASACINSGLSVGIINGISGYHTSPEMTFDAIRRQGEKQGPPCLVGFTGADRFLFENLWLARQCKQLWPEVSVILGQEFATLAHKRLLESYPEFDYVCRGDGEKLVPELVHRLRIGRRDGDGISGLSWRKPSGEIGMSAPEVVDLDTLAWPQRPDIHVAVLHGYGVAVSGSRGCPYRCAFCTSGNLHTEMSSIPRWRMRNINDLVDEIAFLCKDHGARRFLLTDEVFVVNSSPSHERAEMFARELLKRNLSIEFMFDCRVDGLDPDLFTLLYEAGLRQVFVGVETGNSRQLETFQKSYGSREDLVKRWKGVEQIGIKITPGMILFHAEVSPEEIRDSLELIESLQIKKLFSLLNRVNPIPGTALYEDYRRKGYLTYEWPIAEFRFQDPAMERLYNDLWEEYSKPGTTFESLRETLHKKLIQIEAGAGARNS
ncbi:MAG: radical SAM protein [Candidatus Ozemobacteraceae bacterium]